jgi:response regulator of citrate/malate metabolism
MTTVKDTILEQKSWVDDMSEQKIDKVIQLLEEMLKWVKFDALQKAKATLSELLRTEAEKLTYEYSDGRTSRELAEIVKVSHVTVSNYWKKWAKYGVLSEVISRGGTRYKKIFNLSDLGIDVPKITAVRSEVKEESQSISKV